MASIVPGDWFGWIISFSYTKNSMKSVSVKIISITDKNLGYKIIQIISDEAWLPETFIVKIFQFLV